MAIERPLTPLTPEIPLEDIEIEIETVEAEGPAMITDTDDGGVIVDFDPSARKRLIFMPTWPIPLKTTNWSALPMS